MAAGGLLLSGAPTAISQRWPGCPCSGFKFAVVVFEFVFAGVDNTGVWIFSCELIAGKTLCDVSLRVSVNDDED
jgi:hypothetical protein